MSDDYVPVSLIRRSFRIADRKSNTEAGSTSNCQLGECCGSAKQGPSNTGKNSKMASLLNCIVDFS